MKPLFVIIPLLSVVLSVGQEPQGQGHTLTVPSKTKKGNASDRHSSDLNAEMGAGERALLSKDLPVADKHYTEALRMARTLKQEDGVVVVLDDLLRTLSNIKYREHLEKEAETLLLERVSLHEARPDTSNHSLGLALFDMESFYGGSLQVTEASKFATRAVEFYKNCSQNEAWRATCGRRLADVQGMMGSIFFNAKRFEEAQPWFEAVVARGDEGVRPEIMLVSLQAYAKILWDSGHLIEAQQAARRAEEFRSKHPGADSTIR